VGRRDRAPLSQYGVNSPTRFTAPGIPLDMADLDSHDDDAMRRQHGGRLVPLRGPDLRNVLTEVCSVEGLLGIISNERPDNPARYFELLGTQAAAFDLVIMSGELGIGKPNAEIFLAALRRAKVTADCAVYVRDSVHNDIAPATRLGMRAIRFAGLVDDTAPYPGVQVIRDLRDLPSVLEGLNQTAVPPG
jgi:FMN phosphatase YigB (HAD superfamily)